MFIASKTLVHPTVSRLGTVDGVCVAGSTGEHHIVLVPAHCSSRYGRDDTVESHRPPSEHSMRTACVGHFSWICMHGGQYSQRYGGLEQKPINTHTIYMCFGGRVGLGVFSISYC